jgi:hypothetical protein
LTRAVENVSATSAGSARKLPRRVGSPGKDVLIQITVVRQLGRASNQIANLQLGFDASQSVQFLADHD